MAELECFFDCSSPWTYFAFESLLRMQDEIGVTIQWRPFLVGGVFNAVNPSVYNSRDTPVPAKSAYSKKDQQDWARYLGLPIHYRPSVFPVNSVKAMRACIVLEPEGKLVPFARADLQGLLDRRQGHLASSRADRDLRRSSASMPASCSPPSSSNRSRTRCAPTRRKPIDRGSFGSPTIFVGGDDMYFGNDRMPLIKDAVLRRRK